MSILRPRSLPILGCLLLAACTCASLAASEVELQWPWWHGPYSNQSAVPADGAQLPMPRLRWYGTEFTKLAHGHNGGSHGLVGGCQSVVLHQNRLYVSFYVGSDHRVLMDEKFDSVDTPPKPGSSTVRDQYRNLVTEGKSVGLYGKHLYEAHLTRVGFTEQDIDRVLQMAYNVHADDVMVCFDALTGEALWRTAVPGGYHLTRGSYGPHLTPAVDPTTGRVYAIGTTGRVLCFDGETGEHLWTNEDGGTVAEWERRRVAGLGKRVCGGCNRNRYEAAFAVDGVVVVEGRGIDGATGVTLWQLSGAHWQWLPWRFEGSWYLINGGNRCVEPRTGRVLWYDKEPTNTGDEGLAVALEGDRMVCENACYQISLKGRNRLWSNEDVLNNKTSGLVIHQGRVYLPALQPDIVAKLRADGAKDQRAISQAYPKKHAVSVLGLDLASGEIVKNWPVNSNFYTNGSLMVAVDGRLVLEDFRVLDLADPDPASYNAQTAIARSTAIDGIGPGMHLYAVQTPAAYKGRLYYRGGHSVFCLDFNAKPEPMPAKRAADPASKGLSGALAALGAAGKPERQAALERLLADPPRGSGERLLSLLMQGSHQTAAAAAQVLQALEADAALGKAIGDAVEPAADKATATRLGLGLAAWYRHAPEACAAWVAKRLGSGDPAGLRQIGEALSQTLVSRSAELIAADPVVAALAKALGRAKGPALDALGRAIGWLDVHPSALAKLAPALRAVADAPPAIVSAFATLERVDVKQP